MMLHTKYKGSRPYCFKQEDFFIFFPYKPMLNMWPPGQAHFWPHGHNLNKLGRGSQGDATYQL